MKEKLLELIINKLLKKKGLNLEVGLSKCSLDVGEHYTTIFVDGGIRIKNEELQKILEEKL